MTEQIELNGKTYEITDGVVRAAGREFRANVPPIPAVRAPKGILARFQATGARIPSGYAWYAGAFIPMDVAQIAETQRHAVREQKARASEEAIPGLEELRAAMNAETLHREECNRMMEDEQNDGARPPKTPTTDIEALRARYPVAAAYLEAESWSLASHDAKASAGRRAMDAIRAGTDYRASMATMATEWSQYTTAHVWD